MSIKKRDANFANTEEGKDIRSQLLSMMKDSIYNTTATYSSKTEIYNDNLIPFVDKHMNYLTSHPNLDASLYLANLRLMTKQRTE